MGKGHARNEDIKLKDGVLSIDSSNNLGIGVSSPSAKLHIGGSLFIGDEVPARSTGDLAIEMASNGTNYIFFRDLRTALYGNLVSEFRNYGKNGNGEEVLFSRMIYGMGSVHPTMPSTHIEFYTAPYGGTIGAAWRLNSNKEWQASSTSSCRIWNGYGSKTYCAYGFSGDENTGLYRVAEDTLGFVTAGVASMRLFPDGNLSIGGVTPTSRLDLYHATEGYSQLRIRTAYTPTGTADTNGNIGNIVWDDSNIYVKTSVGWKKAALSIF